MKHPLAPENTAPRRRPLLAVSLKMYLDHNETLQWVRAVKSRVTADERYQGVPLAIFPSFTELSAAAQLTSGTQVSVGGQNASYLESGPMTGEVSVSNLAQIGCQFVELGHAERRAHFNETDESVQLKCEIAHRHGLIPLICVGETEYVTPQAAADTCVVQVRKIVSKLPAHARFVVAYEPVWAIGKPQSAPVEHIEPVLQAIRAELLHRTGTFSILYGGAAGPGLISQLPSADGLFLGRFAHDPDQLLIVLDEILERMAKTTPA